jgi:ATP-dependent helicase/nuclease subunit A
MTEEVLSFVDAAARAQASDPTLNVALEASAGTGKTRVLVDRYLRLLEAGSAPRHILAITFTRKAAGEMKTRIIEELRKRPSLWSEMRTRIFEMHVTTIDAFCLGLLREFPLEAGLDPDVALLDEVTSERLKDEAVDETLSSSRRGRGADLRFLVARFGEAALRRGMREFLQMRLTREDLLRRYVDHVIPPGVTLETALRRFSQSLDSALRGKDGVEKFLDTGPGEDRAPAFRAVGFALTRGVDPETASPADVEEIRSYFLTSDNEPRRRLSPLAPKEAFLSSAAYERHRDAVLALAPSIARAYRQWIREKDFFAVRQIEALYRQAAARYRELKREGAGLDFTDVLLEAVSLLEKRGEFSQSRFRLESRYHHLLIDEFQDTNEYQWRLIRALVESWGEGSGLVQEAILAEQARGPGEGRIQEPSLFLVGDRKQSIYGWRDARVEVMEKASRHLLRIRSGAGRKLTLRHSFRASGELLSFLNDLFSELPRARADLEWSFQYRESDHFPTPGAGARGGELKVALATGKTLGEVASAVADEIVLLLEERDVRPKDIAILFRARSSYRAYEEALVARGVPAYVYRGLGFFDSPEVMDVQALVRFLAEPGSELRAAELARSRFVAVSDSALVRMSAAFWRRSAGSPIARWLHRGVSKVDLPLSEGDRVAIARAGCLIPPFVALVDRIPASELLERVVEETDYPRWFVGERQAWENLKKVMEIVRRAENRGYLTMSRLADFLASAATDDESRAALEAVDAVNLMTIHAAKGLEFDTCFLVNMHQRRREDTSLPRIRELPDGQIEVTALGAAGEDDALAREPNRVEEEEKRLLYVALTRARKRLALSAVLAEGFDSERSLLGLLPQSFRERFREALESESGVGELEWRGHPLRILRPAEGRTFHARAPERRDRLRLEPLTADAYEPLVAVSDEEDTARENASLPPELLRSGRILRAVPFALARGSTVVRGVIDLLVVKDGEATVIERLPGPPSAEDRIRMDTRLEFVETLEPGRGVKGIFIFPGAPPMEVKLDGGKESDQQLSLFPNRDSEAR